MPPRIDETLQCGRNSKRGRAMMLLKEADGAFVARNELMVRLYGSKHKENRESMRLLVKGLRYLIRDRRLPFDLIKIRKEKEIYYAIKQK